MTLLSTLLSSVRSTFRTCDKLARARYANIDKYTSPSWFSIKNEPCWIRPSFHRFRPSTEIFYVTHRLFHRALLLFFSLPRPFFPFFFFSKPTKQIFSKRSRWQLVKISNHRLAKPIMHALSSVNRFTSVTVRLITTLSDSIIFPHLQAFDFSNKRWRQFLWPRLIFVLIR